MSRLRIKNNKGLASIEAATLMVLFVVMVYYTIGFFGVVHTGVLHNIHARSYVTENFRHRANLWYFRSNALNNLKQYYQRGSRVHGINTDMEQNPNTQKSTERPITMGLPLSEEGRTGNIHNDQIHSRVPASGRSSVAVNPVWIMVLYGVCLNSTCTGTN